MVKYVLMCVADVWWCLMISWVKHTCEREKAWYLMMFADLEKKTPNCDSLHRPISHRSAGRNQETPLQRQLGRHGTSDQMFFGTFLGFNGGVSSKKKWDFRLEFSISPDWKMDWWCVSYFSSASWIQLQSIRVIDPKFEIQFQYL